MVLSAGAIGSPAILMRSGLGPGARLKASGRAVLRDLPEVPLSRLLLQRLLRIHILYVSTFWLECPMLSEMPVLYLVAALAGILH